MITSVESHFGFWDVTARGDASIGASQNQPWADINDINLGDPAEFPDVATLEPDFGWPLGGTKDIMPDDPSAYTWGWWSTEMSRADGSFASTPVLDIRFFEDDGVTPTVHSSAGITMNFVATLPKRINVKWYDYYGNLMVDQNFEPDINMYFCEHQVEDYSRIAVSVYSMSDPDRWLRCNFILFGVLEILDNERITKATVAHEVHPISLSLPIGVMELSFFTKGGRFSLLDPDGAYKLFQWKQQVKTYENINGVRRIVGIHFLQEATTDDSGGDITALSLVDHIGVLDTLDYDGGIYERKPVDALLDELLTPEEIEYELSDSLAVETVTGYLPQCTKRDALQQIAFAIGAMIDTSRSTALRLYPAPTVVSHAVGPGRKIVGHKVTMEELVTRVDITAHSYQLSGEEKEISKQEFEAGRHTITHSTPVYITKISAGTIVTNHPNYTEIDIGLAGEYTLTGKEYLDTTTIYTEQTYPLPAGAKSSVKSIKEATLVDPSRAQAVAQRVYNYYQQRYTDEGGVLPGAEAVGQRIELQSQRGRSLTGTIQRLHKDLAGGCIAQMTMRGA